MVTSLRSQAAAAAKAAGQPLTAATQTQIQHHALATGFSHGFLVTAAIGLLALIIALAAIRVTREDLSGVDPLAAPADCSGGRAGALMIRGRQSPAGERA